MSKKIIIGIIILVVLVVILLMANRATKEPVDFVSLEEAKEIAGNWIVNNAPTYVFDGSELDFVRSEEISEGEYKLTFEFESSAAGYGDRTHEIVAQVITEHEIEIVVKNGQVASAVTDGVYDEIKGAIIEETLPETMEVILYFVKTADAQEGMVAVNRSVPYTLAVARAALESLIEGPLAHEKAEGLSTAIPEGTELQDIFIENGTATADFNEKLHEGVAGSARVTMIRDQIEQTLLQFDTIDQVVITIDGQSEGILQP